MRLKKFRWLYPGLKIKRWISTTLAGLLLVIIGTYRVAMDIGFLRGIDIFVVALGILTVFLGIKFMLRSLLRLFSPFKDRELLDIVLEKRYLMKGPKICTIGGGTGLSALLVGIKEYTSNITAIVTVADDGGSSGLLREEFDILPPGDIRNCLVALAETEPLMRELFQFRFDRDSHLKGHNFGNLFITAMTKLTGDFEKALEASSKVLAIRGKVIPSTLSKVKLSARFKDGDFIEGETNIPKKEKEIERVFLNPMCSANPKALESIKSADIIILGPGSLFTSIIPNLLIKELTEEIVRSKALKVFICNIMTQHGETDNFTASQHLKALIEHSHPKIVDVCVVNTQNIPEELLEKYAKEMSFPVKPDVEEIEKMGYKTATADLVLISDYVRHDPKKLAQKIMEVWIEYRQKKA